VFDAEPLVLEILGDTSNPRSVVPADVDGDGDLDLVVANSMTHQLVVFFQAGAGEFFPIPLLLGDPAWSSAPHAAAAGDVDGDGWMDLVSASALSGTVTVFFQVGSGLFDPQIPGNQVPNHGGQSVAIADVDGDGWMDIVSVNDDGDALSVFFQIGPRVFHPDPLALLVPGETPSPQSVVAADVDGDGDQDLVSANQNHTLTVLLQSGPGDPHPQFEPQAPLLLGGGYSASLPLAVSDMDGDGALDLVSGAGTQAAVFFQEQTGGFDPEPLVVDWDFAVGLVESLAVADVDGDGDQDLVCANHLASTNLLAVFLQDELGAFEQEPQILEFMGGGFASGPEAVSVADIDGDGSLDLVFASTLVGPDILNIFFNSHAP
jgi:hypothetical protein